ncbi:hypothetical protein KR032_002058 [Drosophila birchii]|nr:hypothetical protein KR032_002058 [Drosophila birchii]
MLRSLAVEPLLLLLLLLPMMSVTIDAKSVKLQISTTAEPVEDSTYMDQPDGTVTVDVDADLILTTSPESEIFTEPSPFDLTEEPLPESVIQQQDWERTQEERSRNPSGSEDTEEETEETTTRKSYRFGDTTNMALGSALSTSKTEVTTTESTWNTTQYEETATVKNYFKSFPASLANGDDMEMAENRMETTTERQDYSTTPVMIMTTEAGLVKERVTYHPKTDRAETVTTLSPLFRFFTTASTAKPLVTETQPETTTIWPNNMEEVATTMPALMESTEPAESNTIPPPSSATEPVPLIAKMELYLSAAAESSSTARVPETTTSTSSAPEATTIPETTTISISAAETTSSTTIVPETTTTTTGAPETTTTTTSAPETTTSTTSTPETFSLPETTTPITSAPETTTSTTSAPETTTSTTSAPETTTSTTSATETTTSTTSAPEITTSTTSAPETTTPNTSTPLTTIPSTRAPETTTTTPRPILTRAPRVERIFNSDGVEVLYGYSSVVRTNRS